MQNKTGRTTSEFKLLVGSIVALFALATFGISMNPDSAAMVVSATGVSVTAASSVYIGARSWKKNQESNDINPDEINR